MRSRPEKLWPMIVNSGFVSFTIQAMLKSNNTRVTNAPIKPSCRARACLSRGAVLLRIEMKMMLSTPRTTSRAVSVSSPIQAFGSLNHPTSVVLPPRSAERKRGSRSGGKWGSGSGRWTRHQPTIRDVSVGHGRKLAPDVLRAGDPARRGCDRGHRAGLVLRTGASAVLRSEADGGARQLHAPGSRARRGSRGNCRYTAGADVVRRGGVRRSVRRRLTRCHPGCDVYDRGVPAGRDGDGVDV